MTFNRRDFLLMGSLAGLGMVFKDSVNITEKIADGMLSNAYAQQVGAKRIFSLNAIGGFPNWMFTQSLYPDEEVIPTTYRIPGVGTGFDASGDSVFTQQKRGDYWFPKLWFAPVPVWTGSAVSTTWVSPETLLDNFLGVRGIWNASDGHQLGQNTMFKPLGSNLSLHGIIADGSPLAVPSVIANSGNIKNEFSSSKGLNPLSGSTSLGVVTSLKDSFKQQVSIFRSTPALDSLVTESLNKFEKNSRFKISASNYNRKKAEELVRANLANLLVDFNAKKAKYVALISAACKYDPADSKTQIPGLFDNPITNYTSTLWKPDNNTTPAISYAAGRDLRELFTTPADLANVADSFAMAEVMFDYNLSSNVVSGFNGIKVVSDIQKNGTGGALSGNANSYLFDDGHEMGLNLQTLVFSVYSRGMITCLYEFVSYLKTKNFFNDTVITFSSDFSRSTSFDGASSNHGWQANSFSAWSGAIKTPTVIGNTMLDASTVAGGGYKNLWGVGRKSTYLGNYVGAGNVNTTLADLVGVPTNSENSKSLIKIDAGGNITPTVTTKTT